MTTCFISKEISQFLKHRRANLPAGSYGFSIGHRRGTGLRREEVAQLSGVSVTWYTWLEQGKDIRVSRSMLRRLADALRLNETEHRYLIGLIEQRDTVLNDDPNDGLPDSILKTIDAIGTPAFVRNACWDMLYWNSSAAEYVGNWTNLSNPLNILRLAFRDEKHQSTILDWERTAREMVAQFRSDFGQNARYPGMSTLVEELLTCSEVFKNNWARQEVLRRETGLRTFRHPLRGDIKFERACLKVDSLDTLKLEVYIPLSLKVDA